MTPFGMLDYAVLAVYLVGVSVLGASFYRRKTTSRELFLGGRTMSWLPVAISIMAADTSAITIMGVPAWGFKNNIELVWLYSTYLIAAPIVIGIFIPFYSRLNLFTAYEYLERRFGLAARLVTSLQFQLLRGVHLAIAIYAPALTLSVVAGVPIRHAVLLMGAVTTVYTTFGGMKAVIWTDVIQFSTVCLGMILVAAAALHSIDGGIVAAWNIAMRAGKFHFFNPSLNPAETTALWPCLVGGTLMNIAALTTDQALLQRLFTTRTRLDCERSVIYSSIINTPLMTMLMLLGVLLFAFYSQSPEKARGLTNSEAVLPFFALQNLPVGVRALVIAAIFAASMAVMSAGINALSTATTVDFYQRLIRADASPQAYARFGRGATVFWGMVSTIAALYMGRLGPLALAYGRVTSFISGPLLGIFLLGLMSRRTNSGGVLAGAGTGLLCVVYVSLGTKWSFLYQSAIGLVITCLFGYGFSLLAAPPNREKIEGLCWIRRHPARTAPSEPLH